MKSIALLGIDLAKNIYHLHGVDGNGKCVYRKKVYRSDLLPLISQLKGCRIVMEVCGGANYWARKFEEVGHKVDLISPQYVKPFVMRNKNDWKDAEAITVAASQASMRYVPKKSEGQQDIQNLHRIRERLVGSRTRLVNEMRGLLMEYGLVFPKGRQQFGKIFLEKFCEYEDRLSPLAIETFYDLWREYLDIDKRVLRYEKLICDYCKEHPVCQRLLKIPGIGPLTATALVAKVSDMNVFKNGREFSAWLGLTPREHSTGGKQVLLGISKRGDKYLRKLLVHGARITLRYVDKKTDRVSVRAGSLKKAKGTNKAAVALANKNARAVYVIMAKDQEYKTFPIAA